MNACERGDILEVTALIDQGADANGTSNVGLYMY